MEVRKKERFGPTLDRTMFIPNEGKDKRWPLIRDQK